MNKLIDDESYLIKFGSKVEKYCPDSLSTLLLSNTVENAKLSFLLEKDKLNLLLKSPEQPSHYPFYELSEVIGLTEIKLYDHPQLTSKYPNGIISGNYLLISASMYQSVIDAEININYNPHAKINSSFILFANCFKEILEHKYKIKVSPLQHQQIYIDYANNSRTIVMKHLEQMLSIYKSRGNLTYIEPEILVEQLKSLESNIKDNINISSNEYIDFLLSKEKQSQLDIVNYCKEKLSPLQIDLIDKLSETQFFELYNTSISNPMKMIEINHGLKEMYKSLLNDSNKTLEEKINTLSNILSVLRDDHFTINFNNLIEEVYNAPLNSKNLGVIKDNVIEALLKHDNLSEKQKYIISKSINELGRFKRDTRIELVVEEKYNLEKEYIKLCEIGELEKVQKILNHEKYKISANIEHNEALVNAMKNGNIQLIKYLLLSPEISNNAQVEPVVVNSMKEYKEETLLSLFDDEQTYQKLNLDNNIYDFLYLMALHNKNKPLEVLMNKQATSYIQEKCECLNKLFNMYVIQKNCNFYIKLILDNLETLTNENIDNRYTKEIKMIDNAMHELFIKALKFNDVEKVKICIFDYQIKMTQELKKEISRCVSNEEMIEQMENLLSRRELKKALEKELINTSQKKTAIKL